MVQKLNLDKKTMRLYLVTDSAWVGELSLAEQVEQSLIGGASFVQIREKNLDFDSFVKKAIKIKKVTDKYKIPFVVNDNIEVALKVDADGVHVGQSDLTAKNCRKILGNDKILGVSAQTVVQALNAQENGADYIGVGAVFSTNTKGDASELDFETIKNICNAVSIPVVLIGGINENNINELNGIKADGIAVISAILASNNIKKTSEKLLDLSNQVFG